MRLTEWIQADLTEVNSILSAMTDDDADALLFAILGTRRIFVLGLGRSGLILRMFAMRLMQLGLEAHVVGDPTTPAIGEKDLLIALSGSGRTETVVNLARKARYFGARVLAVTSGADTPLAQIADVVVIAPSASVKTDPTNLTRLPLANAVEQAMAIYLDCIGAMLAEQRKQDNTAMMRRHANLE